MNQSDFNKDEEAFFSENLRNATTASTALRDRAELLAERFDKRPSRRYSWKLMAAGICVIAFGLLFASTKANAQFAAFIIRGISFRPTAQESHSDLTLPELMKALKDRDHLFRNYAFEGRMTMKYVVPADPPGLAASRPEGLREKFSKAHWETQTNDVRTWTVGDVWRFQATGDTNMSYSSDDNEPMVSPDSVTFSRYPLGGSAETNMQVIAQRHPVLALGLGRLKNAALRRTGTHLQLTGKDPLTGTNVTATFSDPQDMRLESLVRKDGYAIQNYTYGDYAEFGDVAVPTSISYALSLGEQQDLITYKVDKVDTSLKEMPPLEPWFKPGPEFIDERVTPPVRFTYSELLQLNGGKTVLDAKALLVFSKMKAMEDANKARGSDPMSAPAHK